jgi:hypothetical protein
MRAPACPSCGFSQTNAPEHHPTLPQNTVTTDPYAWQQLIDLESEITRVKALLHQLEQQRSRLKRQLNACRSPVLQLPPELTSEIFVTYLAHHEWDGLTSCLSDVLISRTPLLFGRICSAWRELAWSTPKLWSSMQLDLENNNIDPILVNQWLDRSGSLPLSICALLRCEDYDQTAVVIMDAIAQHTERWCNIAFELPIFCYDSFKDDDNLKCYLPNLQHIFIGKESLGLDEFSRFDIFSVTPQLRSLSLKGVDVSDCVFSTNNLTKLRIEGECIDACMDILQRSPHIIECAFVNVQNTTSSIKHSLSNQLQLLRLEIPEEYDESIADIFNALTVPALRKFHFYAEGQSLPPNSFISLMTRSSCSLQTLTLEFVSVGLDANSDDELLQCLDAIPSLQELTLIGVRITDNTLRMLSCRDSSVVLPNLKVFDWGGSIRDFSVLVGFLHSRWDSRESTPSKENSHTISRLQSVNFWTFPSNVPDPDLLAQLQQFVEEGMEITRRTCAGTRSLFI